MRIQTEYSSYDFQAHQQRSQRRCCFSQTALLWFEVLPDMSPALPDSSPALPGGLKLVVGAPRLVAGAPSYSAGRQDCPPRVWYSPEIDASKFTLHILSDTPGGFQWLKYIVLMILGCRWLAPQAIGREEKLMVNEIKHFHSCEHWFFILNDLGGICIVKQELFNLNPKLTLRAPIQLVNLDNSSMYPIWKLSSNGTYLQFRLCTFWGVVNIVNSIEGHWTESKTSSFVCLQIDFERWTAVQLTHRWCTWRSPC